MKKFRNQKETKKVGSRIEQLRKAAGFNIADIENLTGFSYKTISNIEKGSEATISYIIEIAKAIGVHPMDIFDIKFDKQPRFKLSPKRKERNKTTQLIEELYNQTDFFNSPRYVRDVIKYLEEQGQSNLKSVGVSVALTRFVNNGLLKATTVGRQKQYNKKKNK